MKRIGKYARGNPLSLLVMALGIFVLAACGGSGGGSDEPPAASSHTVSYDNEGVVTRVDVGHGALLATPASPAKGGSHYFVGWFRADGQMWDFAHDRVEADLTLKARHVELSASNVIVDAYLDEGRRTSFTFRTLQELKAAAIADGTTVNFAPGVYWTDDYKDPASANTPEHPGLIGISFPQTGLIFKGLTSNADDVRIAGNRGQTMGSNGNWNVIGIGTDFSAYNVTFGNYTSVDLVYPRDPSQNLPRRTDARVQAQTITKADGVSGDLDRMRFENVRFVSFLNLIAIGPKRVYFKDSYFQLTDDAIAGGAINVFENCTFDFYGSHPSYSGSTTIAAFLNSTFNFYNDSGVFWFSKSGGNWALVDNVFKGPKEEIRWENTQRPNVTHYVYNNRYEDGSAVVFDPQNPLVTESLDAQSLQAFKVGNEYNVHNLLKGSDDWNPSGQQQKLATPFRFDLSANVASVASDNPANEIIVTPAFVPVGGFAYTDIVFEYDHALFTALPGSDGKLHLRANLNATGAIINTVIKARVPNGLAAHVALRINPETVPAPVVQGTPAIAVGSNVAALQITYDHPAFTDASDITWFRGATAGSKDVKVARTTLAKPYKNYQLSAGDVGQYLTAVVVPKYEFSNAGSEITVAATSPVSSGDVAHPLQISTDFANISWEGHTLGQTNVWYADAYKPADITQAWVPDTTKSWEYVIGDRDGALGVAGLRTATQGARLLYQPAGNFSDMSLALELTPEKIAGQGFGSATDQYLEVYLKWDPVSRSGYALRFQRLSADPLDNNKPIQSSGNSVRVSMLEYVNGAKTLLPNSYVESSVYMPGMKIAFKLTGSVLTADVTTRSPQTNTQMGYQLPAEIHFQATVANAASNAGGFGVQFTGSHSAGNRTELERLEVALTSR
ncbi:MAG: hypothetical protein REI09_00320 [Candidatus Dactylopiibacterium sp.]|nr:hypothetical protein [Candidatus Dactylopiibacterium sp.]